MSKAPEMAGANKVGNRVKKQSPSVNIFFLPPMPNLVNTFDAKYIIKQMDATDDIQR